MPDDVIDPRYDEATINEAYRQRLARSGVTQRCLLCGGEVDVDECYFDTPPLHARCTGDVRTIDVR